MESAFNDITWENKLAGFSQTFPRVKILSPGALEMSNEGKWKTFSWCRKLERGSLAREVSLPQIGPYQRTAAWFRQ